jgi:predicted nucleic acid-binding protein
MSARVFVDTTILIYAHDIDASAKHDVAKGILRDLWRQRTGVLSTQVLQEFYLNVTRKIAVPLPKDVVRLVVNSYAIWCIETTPTEIATAFRIEDEFQDRILGRPHYCVRSQVGSGPDSLRGSERASSHRGHTHRKSFYTCLAPDMT